MAKITLNTDVWDSVYTYLQTTNPISTNNIFSSYNSTLIKSKGYPLVIISPPSSSMNKLSVGGQLTQSEIVMTFEIYHTSSASLKSLKDDVVAKLIAGRNTFAGAGYKRMMISGGDTDSWEEGKKKRHRATFDVSFFYVG